MSTPEEDTIMISFRAPRKLIDELDARAAKARRTRSAEILLIIETALQGEEESAK